MMTDQNDAADIAWMRKLAEEGATAPFRGASILMAAGLIFGGASVLHWAAKSGLIVMPPAAFSALWGVATLVFLTIMTVLSLRRRARGGVVTVANRASGVAWSSVGFGIFFLFASMSVISWRIADVSAMLLLVWLVPSVIMVFYGLGWAVTASVLKSRPLWWLAIASFTAAPLLATLAGRDAQYLAYAAALLLLMALPGWLLMRQAKQA